MEFTSLLNTSLDLNTEPLRFLDDARQPKQEVDGNLIGLGRNVTVIEERGALIEELNRVSAENKKLTELLTEVCESYSELRNQLMEHTSKINVEALDNSNPNISKTAASRKRKAESSINNNANKDNIGINNNSNGHSESSSSDEDSSKKAAAREEEQLKAKISRVCVRTEASDTSLIVKDGYQWRKYGQKVTRDNPCPRAYFKCSFAPTCPVKKKVQRSLEDQSIVVATYEGEHNHTNPSKPETATTSGSNQNLTLGNVPCSASIISSGPTITLDLTRQKPSQENTRSASRGRFEAPGIQHYLVEQMASTLTKDPNFKAALAAAISGKFLQHNNNNNNNQTENL
ncbi:WRKY transcription factor [Castilleja foliolosa]|uniref:WRKY transcription factor n=1 Tax=Castilleja foliolosa TaxID=1961234 RepID=A0ABD3ELM0_9LAMI